MTHDDRHVGPGRRPDAELSADERDFVARFRTAYEPPARSAAQRAAFVRALAARRAGRVRWYWAPLAATAAAAGLAIWLAVPNAAPPRDGAAAPGEALLALVVEEDTTVGVEEEFLPDDYSTIAQALEL